MLTDRLCGVCSGSVRHDQRTHRELIDKDIARGIYRVWRAEECGYDADVAGFCRGTPLNEVRKHGHVLTSDGMWTWSHRRVMANYSRTR